MSGPEQGHDLAAANRPEHQPEQPPQIYVASLADYNAGRLVGRWIDASQGLDIVTEEAQQMLSAEAEPGAEEYAIHDYDGWGPLQLSEYESLQTVCHLAEGIAAHGLAFAHLAAQLDRDEWSRLDRFDELYRGHWPSAEDFAQELLNDIGIDLDEIGPEIIRPYIRIDLEAFARDLMLDFMVSEDSDGVHIFEQE